MTLDGVRFDAVTEHQCARQVIDAIDRGEGGWVITPNLDHMCRSRRDDDFRSMLDQADIVVADGMPLIWACRIQGTPLPCRVPGSSLIITLSRLAGEHGKRVFLLGGDPGTADAAAAELKQDIPGLTVCGTHCPPMGFETDPQKMQAIEQAIDQATPDIVFVALGSPKQERLIRTLKAGRPAAWWLGVGISFSFIAGEVVRAPRWMQACGMEWIHRLAQEPKRLAKRYLVDGIPFACRMMIIAAMARTKLHSRAKAA